MICFRVIIRVEPPNCYYTTGCARWRARLTFLTPQLPCCYESRTANFYQELSEEQSAPCFFTAFFFCQCWLKTVVILANHARSFANSKTSTEAKYLTLFG